MSTEQKTNTEKETKLCKHCKTEIPKDAKVCPNCHKKQNGKWVIIIVAVVVLILIAAIAGNSGEEKSTKIDNSNAAKSEDVDTDHTSADTDANDTSADNEEDTSDVVVRTGGNFETSDLKVTVDEAVIDYQVEDNTYGLYDLDEGLMYIAVTFTFENIGDSDQYVSIYDFDCYADGTLCEQKYLNEDFVNANLSAGRNVSFTTYYAVPETAQSVELEYTENVWTDEKVYIQILP